MLVRKFHILIFVCLCQAFTCSSTFANESKALYQTCAACHGAQGEGNRALAAPALAGQFDWYTSRQLESFKNNIRGFAPKDSHGQQMKAFATTLDFDKDVPALVDYIAKMPTPKINETIDGDLKNGSRYYQAKCGACHGGKAEGNSAFKAPKLANQQPSYILRQMKNFVAGIRGSKDGDRLGKQMAMMATTVSEQELNDIVYYISQQP